MRACLKLGVTIIFSFFLVACNKNHDHVDLKISDQEKKRYESLISRYSEYWENRTQGIFDRSYEFELPYINYLKPLVWYKEFHADDKRLYNTTLIAINSDPDDKEIVYLKTELKLGDKVLRVFGDKWINVNNRWYHFYHASNLPPL